MMTTLTKLNSVSEIRNILNSLNEVLVAPATISTEDGDVDGFFSKEFDGTEYTEIFWLDLNCPTSLDEYTEICEEHGDECTTDFDDLGRVH